jgi:periplasmic protein TonB
VIRLAVAALLALGVHASLYWIRMPWSQPHLTLRQSRTISIDLVTFQKPTEKAAPPSPKVVQPKPRPKSIPESKPKPKPKPKPVVPAPPVTPRSITPEPPPQPMVETQSFDAGIGVQEAELAPDVVAAEAVPPVGAAQQPAVQVSVPRYDLNPPPHYPRVARRRKYTGIVTLNVRVTADGRVAQVRIADSSGYAVLDRSAAISVKAWQFTPARRGGLPVAMWVRVPVRYELR